MSDNVTCWECRGENGEHRDGCRYLLVERERESVSEIAKKRGWTKNSPERIEQTRLSLRAGRSVSDGNAVLPPTGVYTPNPAPSPSPVSVVTEQQ